MLLIPWMLLMMLPVSACGGSDRDPFTPEVPGRPENPGEDGNEPDPPVPGGKGRYLILYCSRTSNTERVAQQIRTTLGCDIRKVEPRTAYENDYEAMLGRAQSELAAIRRGNYPAIRTSIESFEQYDMIFVGYPIWYGSMATPMQTFLHEHAGKLTGKRIALFATSGSSGISASAGEAQALCSGATFTETLLLTASSLPQTATRVTAWLERIGAGREQSGNDDQAGTTSMKVNMAVGGRTITATLEDHVAGRDFLSRLPLEVMLNDYAGAEKIFYPQPALSVEGVTRGCTPVAGDITLYVPWGNVAVFYRNGAPSNDLIRIGRIDGDGIDALSAAGNVAVKFEKQ